MISWRVNTSETGNPGSSSAFGFWIETENESGLEPVRTARVSAPCVSTGFELYGFCIGL